MKRATKLAVAAVLVLSSAISSQSIASPRPPRKSDGNALATVNGDPVTSKDLLDLFTDRHSGHAKFLGGEAEAKTFLNIVIDDRLLVQEAYELGLDQDDTLLKLVRELEDTKARDLLVNREIDQKARPTEEEVRAAWKDNLTFVVQARQIAVATREEAEEIRRALLSGADFETLARSCSISSSRMNGGYMMANWGPYGDAWEKVVFSMQPGEISPVIQTDDGFEIVILEDRRDIERPNFEKVKGDIETVLQRRKLEARRKDFEKELWTRYHVVLQPLDFSPSELAKLLATAPDTVIATWDDGGARTLKEALTADDINEALGYTPLRARRELESKIRATINDPLVIREARNRKLGETGSIAQEVDKYREYTIEALLFRDHIFKDLVVSEDESRKYYAAHPAEFELPEQRHVAHVMVSSEEQAKAVIAALAGGMTFEDAAKKFSRDFQTALSGGDLGWITAEKVPPAFKDVLTMKAGSVSKPIHSDRAWHVVKVLEVKAKEPQPFEAVKDKASAKVLDEKKREAREAWVAKLRAASKIQLDDKAIAQFVKENQMKSLEAPSMQHAVPASGVTGPHSGEEKR